jgi:L,D-transpeptidase ErfK/SrfK
VIGRTELGGLIAAVRSRLRPWMMWCACGVFGVLVVSGTTMLALGDRRSEVRLDGSRHGCQSVNVDEKAVNRAAKRLAQLRPKGRYIVIDSHRNRLSVYDGDTLLREMVCSTASGTVLIHPSGKKVWTFDSPLGERRVLRKTRQPVWSKPDWAFIEEGFEPPKDPSLRIDTVSLGDYGLYLGDGYIIHGTLFQTLLGQGVTHGCVRLGDADLKYVYDTIPVGARVYIF